MTTSRWLNNFPPEDRETKTAGTQLCADSELIVHDLRNPLSLVRRF
jgi:hypothetical protein